MSQHGTNRKLFGEPRTTAPTVTVHCAGCPTTATTDMRGRRGGGLLYLPECWTACGETVAGDLALWCSQCAFEGRVTVVGDQKGTS